MSSIYISLYRDGVYRQRCQEHLYAAPADLMGVWKVLARGRKTTCPVCWWEKRTKGGEGDVEVAEAGEEGGGIG